MRYVLFVCNHNAGRSQIAQAFFERDAPEGFRAESAGTNPARKVHPEVLAVMREVDIDLEGRRPQRLSLEMQLHADWAVTMGCGDACPYVPTRVDDWTDVILADYDDAPVRSFVQAIADRRVRACLKREVCEPSLSA